MKMGPLEIVIILVIVLMVFGVGKLPQIASSIGQSLKSFREGQQGVNEEDEAAANVKRTKRIRKKPTKEKTGEASDSAPGDTAATLGG